MTLFMWFSGITLMSFFLTLVIEFICHRLHLLDHPSSRKTQKSPVPRFGGLIFFLIPISLSSLLDIKVPEYLFISATLVFLGGFLDDLSILKSALMKLVFQVPAVIYFSYHYDFSFLQFSPTLIIPLKIIMALYLLFMINASNLMDNINGLTSGLNMIWLLGLLWLSLTNTAANEFTLALAVMFTCMLGFYLRNFPWGKIYMGDQGSQLLGFFSATMSLLIIPKVIAANPNALFLSTVSLFIISLLFIIDVITVTFIRIKEKRPIWHGDQCHISHQLIRRGLSPCKAALVLTLCQFLLVIAGLSLLKV